jgi:hypothetical protein
MVLAAVAAAAIVIGGAVLIGHVPAWMGLVSHVGT